MLLHSILITIVVTLATAAPATAPAPDSGIVVAKDLGSSAPASRKVDKDAETAPLEARTTGAYSIFCFDGLDCTGTKLFEWIDNANNNKPGSGRWYRFPHYGDRLVSCRLDVWNGWTGEFHLQDESDRYISGQNYPKGWGQYCVNQLPYSTKGPGYVNKFLLVWPA
ncbi:uncharacterized protein LOC62_02G002297 [Vanrija pseudolonga]|uniref:Uncharacterized protein n=1 Tax=Vanrija pseudolonga TaxID=143232 RepID=A0AAF0Y8C1_9TREE|nr:hypothetical protein LOC62_02G002297 [Vanrija pseudolonga]